VGKNSPGTNSPPKFTRFSLVDKTGFYNYTCVSEETMLSIRYMVQLNDKINIDILLDDIGKEVTSYYGKI
jgi:hypothetical protein